MYKDLCGILGELSELDTGHNERDVLWYMDLKGLHGSNELGEGGDIDVKFLQKCSGNPKARRLRLKGLFTR